MTRPYSEDLRTSKVPGWYEKKPATDTTLLTRTYLGIVRDSRDPQKMGRILVWIPEISGDADVPKNWIICQYCSPFAGASYLNNSMYNDKEGDDTISSLYEGEDSTFSHRTPDRTKGTYSGRQSYGMWFTQPDVGNEVLITFINGDPNFGVWFGSLFPQSLNHMVPGIAESQIFNGSTSDESGPVMEPDYTLESATKNKDNPRKLKYNKLYSGLKYQQGLNNDLVRGQSTSSARRESPSEVFGILTPDGNQFVMDDKQDHEFIRLRTNSGSQILIHQSSGMIYAISRDGTTWLELSNEGNIDIYGAENISIHAEKANVNLKAGQDINIQAGRNLNLKADGNFNIEATDFSINASGKFVVNSGAQASIKGFSIGLTSDTNIGLTAGAMLGLQGAPIMLNSGISDPQAETAGTINTHSPSGPSISSGPEAEWTSGSPYSGGSNIVPRVPQHEPWLEHEIATTGTRSDVVEGPLDPSIPLGASSQGATKPNDMTLPDNRRFEGDSYKGDEPVYIQVADVPACALQPVNTLQIDQAGMDFIKQKEGVRNIPYPDGGRYSVGVGHLITDADLAAGRLSNSGRISDELIDELLLEDLDRFQRAIRGCVTQPMSQEQFNACVSLAFNIGETAFCNSSLVNKSINTGNYESSPNNFMRFNKVRKGGRLVFHSGLNNRRREEAVLFATAPTPCEDVSPTT